MPNQEENLAAANKELSLANKKLSETVKELSKKISEPTNQNPDLPPPLRYLLVMYAVAIVTSVGAISQSWSQTELSLVFMASIRNFVFGFAFLVLGVFLNALWPIIEHFVKLVGVFFFYPIFDFIVSALGWIYIATFMFFLVVGFGHFFCTILVSLESIKQKASPDLQPLFEFSVKPYCNEPNEIIEYGAQKLGSIGIFFRNIFAEIVNSPISSLVFIIVIGILFAFLSYLNYKSSNKY